MLFILPVNIGVGDGGARTPKIREACGIRELIFLNFSTYFSQKCVAPLQLTELLRYMPIQLTIFWCCSLEI